MALQYRVNARLSRAEGWSKAKYVVWARVEANALQSRYSLEESSTTAAQLNTMSTLLSECPAEADQQLRLVSDRMRGVENQSHRNRPIPFYP